MTDVQKVLDLFADGSISKSDAEKLIVELNTSDNEGEVLDEQKKWLKIAVDSQDGEKVRVNIPVSLAKFALKFGEKSKMGGYNLSSMVDIDHVIKMIEEDANGEIVKLDSEEASVLITIE